jgi:hypothetical protein
MISCSHCESTEVTIIRSRVQAGGIRARLVVCKSCRQSSEHWSDPPPKRKACGRGNYRFSDEDVREILLSRCRHSEMALAMQCSSELIRQIRNGTLYAARCAEIARWGQEAPPQASEQSCYQCRHWASDDCGMGFPDPGEEGPGFARDCSLYQVRG